MDSDGTPDSLGARVDSVDPVDPVEPVDPVDPVDPVEPVDVSKRALRARMRRLRLEIAHQAPRSARISARLAELPALEGARTVMVYAALPGEPDLTALVSALTSAGVVVVAPDARRDAGWPVDPATIDAVIVPGLAFTLDGDRLGQGGGWYDRFLAAAGGGCMTIGVCFDEQLIERVPTASHDVTLDLVVSG